MFDDSHRVIALKRVAHVIKIIQIAESAYQ